MNKISEIISIDLKEFSFSYDQQYFYSILEKYKDKVIAFKITDDLCYILLKGKIKYFLAKISLDKNKIWRVKDNTIYENMNSNKTVILNKEQYDRFTKKEIIRRLK